MDVRECACRYTVTIKIIPALRWAAMTAILTSVYLWGTLSQDSVHKPQALWRERTAEAVSSRGLSAYQPNALPLGQTSSQKFPIFWPAIRQADPLTAGLLQVNRKPEQTKFVLKLCVHDNVTRPTGVYVSMSFDLIVNHYASFILIFVRHWSMLWPAPLSVWFALVGGLAWASWPQWVCPWWFPVCHSHRRCRCPICVIC